jgi:hypothetical protein
VKVEPAQHEASILPACEALEPYRGLIGLLLLELGNRKETLRGRHGCKSERAAHNLVAGIDARARLLQGEVDGRLEEPPFDQSCVQPQPYRKHRFVVDRAEAILESFRFGVDSTQLVVVTYAEILRDEAREADGLRLLAPGQPLHGDLVVVELALGNDVLA